MCFSTRNTWKSYNFILSLNSNLEFVTPWKDASFHLFCSAETEIDLDSMIEEVLDYRPFSYSTKEPGSRAILIHYYPRGSIE